MARRKSTTPPPEEDFEEQITDIEVGDEMRSSYLEYAYSVIYTRALPDARDGLKPVQRRILYTMAEMNLRPDRGHVKCGRVVGEVMGKLHPHSDSPIYDALVRLAQSWVMRMPTVDGHGNFGNLDDGPAQMRYCVTGDTRVRLPEFTSRIADLDEVPPNSERDVDLHVLDKDGKPVRVSKIFNSGVQPTKRLVTKSGHSVRGSHNHPVLCLVPVAGVPMFQWLRLDEITPGTVVCLARNAWTTAIPDLQESTLGTLLGGWVSEGFVSPERAGFNNTDAHYFRLVREAYDRLVGGRRYVSTRTLKSERQIWELDIQDVSRLRESPLKELIGLKAKDKVIPRMVLEGTVGLKRAFLMALFEGDGGMRTSYNDSMTVQYSTYSETLANQLQEMLLEFGIHSNLTRYDRGEFRLVVSGRHNIRAFAERIGFLTARGKRLEAWLHTAPKRGHKLTQDYVPYVRNYVLSSLGSGRGTGKSWLVRHNFDRMERWQSDRSLIISKMNDEETLQTILPIMDSGYRFVEVADVQGCEPAEVYSLRVESEDHSFLAGGFVNHNTECRMAPAALSMTASLDEDVVDYKLNYDGREQEPTVLPAAFPNLLVNGASGIAVGMATNMPPHNLGEVVQALRHLLEKPNASLDDLMTYLPGPDLPTGGKIIGLDGIRDAYETGRGAFKMRATTRIENVTPRRKGIVVTELPFNVGPERVIERTKAMVQSKKLQGIADLKDLTDREHGLRLVIEVKNGFNPEAILEQMFKLTPMEESFNINNVALVEGQPRTMGLKDLLEVYLDHRIEVTRRRTQFRLTKAQDRLHLVQGLLIAILDIDAVIALIRASDDAAAAKAGLVERFELSEAQAQYILDLQLRRLTKFSKLELEREQEELEQTIRDLSATLESETLLRRVVSGELKQMAKEHGDPRRTVLLESSGATAASAVPLEVPDDPCRVLLSSTGLLARTSSDELPAVEGDRTNHDGIVSTVRATARGEVGLVTSHGRLIRTSVLDMPALPSTAHRPNLQGGAPVSEFASLRPDERALCLTTLDPDSAGLALGTAHGVVKRVRPEHLSNRDEWEIISLSDGDALIGGLELTSEEVDLVFVTSDAQLLRFAASAVRPQGRSGSGIAGVKLSADASAVFFGAVDPSKESAVVTVAGSDGALPGTDAGSVKVTPFDEFPAKGRATGGVRCHRFLAGEDRLVLAWAGHTPAHASASSGTPIELPEPTGKRDGSGTPADQPIAAIAGAPD